MVRHCGKRWDGGPGRRGHDDSNGGSQELNLAGAWDTHERCRILSICLRGSVERTEPELQTGQEAWIVSPAVATRGSRRPGPDGAGRALRDRRFQERSTV